MRVVASPWALKAASSSRRTAVSMPPRLPAGAAASGAPWNTTLPVKGCEPSQKKPAGRGSFAKLVWANPATVIHRSTPLWTASPAAAKASEPPIKARSKAPGTAERIQGCEIFILRSFPVMG